MTGADKVTLVCSKCGGTLFHQPDDPKPDDVIACIGCGARSRYADVQAEAIAKAVKEAGDVLGKMIRDAFKK